MNAFVRKLAVPGTHVCFHATMLATIITGAAIVLTAGEMGAMAPLLIAFGIYGVFFGIVCEALFWLRHLAAAIARRYCKQSSYSLGIFL